MYLLPSLCIIQYVYMWKSPRRRRRAVEHLPKGNLNVTLEKMETDGPRCANAYILTVHAPSRPCDPQVCPILLPRARGGGKLLSAPRCDISAVSAPDRNLIISQCVHALRNMVLVEKTRQ